MGAQFASTYKSLGACVAQKSQQAATNAQNAAKQCKAELAMTEAAFTAAHGGKTFAQTYGVNVNNKNASGKCGSARAGGGGATNRPAGRSARATAGGGAERGGEVQGDSHGRLLRGVARRQVVQGVLRDRQAKDQR